MIGRSAFCLAAVLAAIACAAQAGSSVVSGVATVIDGDTIDIHGTRIRLHAIDAIESRQRCFLEDGREWRCGKDSAFALADFIGRQPLRCEVNDIDRYGRLVAVCYKGETDINAWLVRNGWALAYRRYGRDYVAEEEMARREKRGIWRSRFVAPWDWRRQN